MFVCVVWIRNVFIIFGIFVKYLDIRETVKEVFENVGNKEVCNKIKLFGKFFCIFFKVDPSG